MNQRQALDDLKAIRQIMDRARKKTGGEGGWFMVTAGAMWLVGLLGNQFLDGLVNPLLWWLPLNTIVVAIDIWLALRMRRQEGVSSPIWRPILIWWLAAALFDVVVIWMLGLSTGQDIALLIILTIGLSYVQFGLFSHWIISVAGALMAALTVGAALLVPDYFHLAVGVLGGGLLIGSGLALVRQGRVTETNGGSDG